MAQLLHPLRIDSRLLACNFLPATSVIDVQVISFLRPWLLTPVAFRELLGKVPFLERIICLGLGSLVNSTAGGKQILDVQLALLLELKKLINVFLFFVSMQLRGKTESLLFIALTNVVIETNNIGTHSFSRKYVKHRVIRRNHFVSLCMFIEYLFDHRSGTRN